MATVTASLLSAAPLLVLGLGVVCFATYCLVAVVRAESVRHLPKWLWVAICCCSVPLGGILYLVFGRPPTSDHTGFDPAKTDIT